MSVKQDSGIYVGSKVPFGLKLSLSHAIKSGQYLNVSDFIRDAIKEKLQKEGFLHNVEEAGAER
jgi:Arc/MetJ-type ribon-helix-helix transcriptional regulator